MKIAYGTYAMPHVTLEEAIPMLAQIGYDGVEIFIGLKHRTMPEMIDKAGRQKLRNLLVNHNLGIPALMMSTRVLVKTEEEHQKNLKHTQRVVELARDIGMREPPVLSVGIGGMHDQWEIERDKIVEYLRDYAKLAEEENFILAGEAHCGAAVDRSERVIWLFDIINHPLIKLHFDIVHFFLSGEKIEDSVSAMVPYTAHTHITDVRRHSDDNFELCLLGQGDLDIVAYIRAMQKAGWTDFITIELSVMVWKRKGYDSFKAASSCYATIDNAFKSAGVLRI